MLPTVMVIDDCELQRYVTETIIRKCLPPAQVIAFNSPVGALVHLHAIENNYHDFPMVILLDLVMPLMNGFDFLDKYLEFPMHLREHCEIIVLSGSKEEEEHERLVDYPFIYQFLSKPISTQKLMGISELWPNNKVAADMFSNTW